MCRWSLCLSYSLQTSKHLSPLLCSLESCIRACLSDSIAPCVTCSGFLLSPDLGTVWGGELNPSSISGCGKHEEQLDIFHLGLAYLTVCIDHGAQQLPGAAAPVHAHHAQDLQEAHTAQRRGGQDVALGTSRDDGHRGDKDDEI